MPDNKQQAEPDWLANAPLVEEEPDWLANAPKIPSEDYAVDSLSLEDLKNAASQGYEGVKDFIGGFTEENMFAKAAENVGSRFGAALSTAGDLFRDEENRKGYDQYLKENQDFYKKMEQERHARSPIASTAGAISGDLAAGMALPIPGAGIRGLPGAAARITGGVATSAALEGLQGDQAFDTERAREAATKAGMIGAGIEAASPVLKPVVAVGKAVGKRIPQLFGGPAPKWIERYWTRIQDLSKVDTDPGELRQILVREAEDDIKSVTNKVALAEDELRAAKQAHKEAVEASRVGWKDKIYSSKDRIASLKQEQASKLSEAKEKVALSIEEAKNNLLMAKDKVAAAKDEFKAATQAQKELHSTKAEKIREQAASVGVQEIKNAAKETSRLSSESYDALANTGARISTQPAIDALDQARRRLLIAGRIPGGSTGKSYEAIKDMQKQITQHGGSLSGVDIKKFIRHLDNEIERLGGYGLGASEKLTDAQSALREARAAIDSEAKNIPQFKTIMTELSGKTGALMKIGQYFDDPVAAQKALSKMADPTNPEGKQLISDIAAFDKVNGTKLLDEVNAYISHVQNGVDPSNLPQYQALSSAEDELQKWQRFKPPALDDSEAIKLSDQARQAEDELQALQRAGAPIPGQEGIQAAQGRLAEAERIAAPLRGTSGATVKSLVAQGIDPSEANKGMEALNYLGEQTGKPWAQKVEDQRILEAMNRGRPMGSAYTNLGAIGGRAVGGAIGAGLGATDEFGFSPTAGAIAGVLGPNYAPKLTRMVMNGGYKAKRYIDVLTKAAQRGQNSVAATHFLMMQEDPEYRKMMTEEQ